MFQKGIKLVPNKNCGDELIICTTIGKLITLDGERMHKSGFSDHFQLSNTPTVPEIGQIIQAREIYLCQKNNNLKSTAVFLLFSNDGILAIYDDKENKIIEKTKASDKAGKTFENMFYKALIYARMNIPKENEV